MSTMTATQVARKVYSAEELHRLRGAQSQPKLREAIEEHDGEDAEIVKEHVLRGTKSFAARSYRSRPSAASLRVPSGRVNNENFAASRELNRSSAGNDSQVSSQTLGEIVGNGQIIRPGFRPVAHVLRPSPTPSIKKKAAQDLVKAHGSPTHVRVTAGGRIVPSEQSPLCHPRYGYSAVKVNGGLIKFAPNQQAGKPQWTTATENGFVAQDVHGNLCQIVDGVIMPLDEVDGALRLHMHAPNLNITQDALRGPAHPSLTRGALQQPDFPSTTRIAAPEPSLESQILALELEYSKLEQEEKDVDKTEVIHGRSMGKVAKDALWTKRRELVTNKDRLRKAIKALKSQPPPNAPTSPRAMHNRHSMSPPRRQGLPPFLRAQPANASLPIAPPLGAYPPYFAGPPQFGGALGAQATPSPEELLAAQPWTMPPASMFAPPPAFDGSVSQSLPPFGPNGAERSQPQGVRPSIETNIAQNDGARSSVEHGNSPGRSHAVSIKAPEPKPTANLKSMLNPMSPAYKPSGSNIASTNSGGTGQKIADRIPTPLSPLHQLQPQAENGRPSNASQDTISPTKKAAHLQSSSIASFDTADFFPRNTREYSTRQHAYPYGGDRSEAKENTSPEQPHHRVDSPLTPSQQARQIEARQATKTGSPVANGFKAPVAPPGTPVNQEDARTVFLPVDGPSSQLDMPNRDAHNVSPKNKREWLFVQERPEQQSSSPAKSHTCQDDVCGHASPYDSIDFSQKPREWIEGYQAGLHRRPVGADRMGDFLDGYCSGLLKSKPASTTSSSSAPSTGSPVKAISRRPSPALPSRTSSRAQLGKELPSLPRPPSETVTQSLDTLKQAMLSPQNKNAVLTPAAEGPHISEVPLNLGAWAKSQQTAPQDISSLSGYPLHMRPNPDAKQAYGAPDQRQIATTKAPSLQPGPQPASPTLSTRSIASSSILSGSAPNTGHRIASLMSIESSMSRQWPGNRVMTPSEWKSESSVAHATSLATGYFANAQFDGTSDPMPTLRMPGQLTDAVSYTGANNQLQRNAPPTTTASYGQPYGRFREGSLDGLSNPPASPRSPLSPTMSAQGTPQRSGSKKDNSPGKGPSPAKAKFEHIAGKVGMKVTSITKGNEVPSSTLEPGSPPDKRRGGWRDIWRKGGRDGTE